MDSSRFDTLAKRLVGSSYARRSALRAGAAALAARLGGASTAEAGICRPSGTICRKDGECCTARCSPSDASGRRRCGHCCFVAGTLVAMADGASRPIELVGFGDLVIGAGNSVSRVIAVETPLLGSRQLFGFNGNAPFVTAEQITAFKKEMDAANVAYEFVNYPGAKHGFTNPDADLFGQKFNMPLAYNAEADKQSWSAWLSFLKGAFAAK